MRNRCWIYLILMTVTLIGMSLLLSQAAQAAQVADRCASNKLTETSTTDTDGDGFTDYQECFGITLANGQHFPGKIEGVAAQLPRSQYLDPDSKDLFVILVRSDDPGVLAGPTKITHQVNNAADVAYWFPFVSSPVGQNTGQYGLGFAVHLITADQAPDRIVCPDCILPTGQKVKQKAVKISESLDATKDNILGYTSSCGIPNGPDLTTVYTLKIYNLLKSVMGTVPQDKLDLYIRHTIAHEIGHTVGPLAPVNYPEYGPYHYQSADNNLIMDQSVYQSENNVYVGTQYTSGDQAGVHLK